MAETKMQSLYYDELDDDSLSDISLSYDPLAQQFDATRLYDPLPANHSLAWRHYLATSDHPRFTFAHGNQLSEVIAETLGDAERVVAEKFPGVGGILVDKNSFQPTLAGISPLAHVFRSIPENIKASFRYLAGSLTAMPASYKGRLVIFTPEFTFLPIALDEKRALREFRTLRPSAGAVVTRCACWKKLVGQLASAWPPSPGGSYVFPSRDVSPVSSEFSQFPFGLPGSGNLAPPTSQQSPQKTARMIENDAKTALMCSIYLRATNLPSDRGFILAQNVLVDTGCTATTVYSKEATRLWDSDIVRFGSTLGITGSFTPSISVKRHVALAGLLPDTLAGTWHYIDVRMALVTVSLLAHIFSVQTSEQQDSLAYALIDMSSSSFGRDEAYKLLEDWHLAGFPTPVGKLQLLLEAMGLKQYLTFPYSALLGYDVYRPWMLSGVDHVLNTSGKMEVWGT